jgi:hypothetical protein
VFHSEDEVEDEVEDEAEVEAEVEVEDEDVDADEDEDEDDKGECMVQLHNDEVDIEDPPLEKEYVTDEIRPILLTKLMLE